MNIQTASITDLPEIARLHIQNWKKTYKDLLPDEFLDCLTPSWAMEKWGTYLTEEHHTIFVAYENKTFLGFAASTKDDTLENCWYLDSLHVSGEARGKGIGTALIRTSGQYALSNGYTRMSICIICGNDSARHLYEKMGAKHFENFIDSFGEIRTNSEKLLWDDLHCFQ